MIGGLRRREIATLLFGRDGSDYLGVLDEFRGSFRGSYKFLDLSLYQELLIADPVEAARVYWKETLYRAHLAASISLLRHYNWVEGAIVTFENGNLLACAACIRGLLESVADADFALRLVPNVLAHYAPAIRRAFKGERPVVLVQDPKLEEMLIHFSHARRTSKSDSTPSGHRARTTQEYLKYFSGRNAWAFEELYRTLCELTHPAADSVNLVLESQDEETGTACEVREFREGREFVALLVPHMGLMPEMFRLGVNTPVLILKILNRLPDTDLHHPIADLMQFEGTEWREISSKLSLPWDQPG
jgi:hypothetical protein